RFIFLVIPPVLYTGISLFMIINAKELPGQITINAFLVSYIISNTMGIIICWRMNRYRRIQYSYYIRQKELNRQLQEALNNIRTLRGLMPICSKCKKIRDEEGYWKHLEEYIEQHTDAHFSHSLCDSCAKELYGDKVWFKK
ncbi:MAG: hypothetical protein ACRCUT_04700, partial [Spirochaetota bacterium]